MKAKKIIATGLVAASILGLGLSNTHASDNNSITDKELTQMELLFKDSVKEMNFDEVKEITISTIKDDIQYETNSKVKKELENLASSLSSITIEKEFTDTLIKAEEKIDSLYNDMEDMEKELTFDEFKKILLDDTSNFSKSEIEVIKNSKTDQDLDIIFSKMLEE